jgi:hypothetical protein
MRRREQEEPVRHKARKIPCWVMRTMESRCVFILKAFQSHEKI